ncbi:MerR family transcriptional regulator [Pseudomonas svalbardensis]|uniref:MerR family transcriptional regulator n=2 Tax=Pseudomonas TaxID=286 RepID=UPI0024B34130|nr:MerR family transcriptional regulator [Pseudomonas sp. PMCC200367]
MFIGRLAGLTGCTPKAIRLYEQIGLIPEPDRQGRYRVYTSHHLTLVRLIRRAQIAGFKLAEMVPLIAAKNTLKAFPLELANEAIDLKRQQIFKKIADLLALADHLSELKSEINSLFEPGAVITPHSDASSAGLDR